MKIICYVCWHLNSTENTAIKNQNRPKLTDIDEIYNIQPPPPPNLQGVSYVVGYFNCDLLGAMLQHFRTKVAVIQPQVQKSVERAWGEAWIKSTNPHKPLGRSTGMKTNRRCEISPFMLGSGFLTAAIGEPLETVGWPARPAGRGDPEVVRPGDSCNAETKSRTVVTNYRLILSVLKKNNRMQRKKKQFHLFVTHLKAFETLTVAPLVGVDGCFANKDWSQNKSDKVSISDRELLCLNA